MTVLLAVFLVAYLAVGAYAARGARAGLERAFDSAAWRNLREALVEVTRVVFYYVATTLLAPVVIAWLLVTREVGWRGVLEAFGVRPAER